MELLKHFSVKVTKTELILYIMASINQTASIKNTTQDFKMLKVQPDDAESWKDKTVQRNTGQNFTQEIDGNLQLNVFEKIDSNEDTYDIHNLSINDLGFTAFVTEKDTYVLATQIKTDMEREQSVTTRH